MRFAILSSGKLVRVVMLAAVICTLSAMTLRSAASSQPLSAVTISNESQWEIRALYLSAADDDNWGADQLNGAVIAPGSSYTLSISWSQPTVKIVAEDKDGCFITTTVDATTNSAWTINSSSARNCGSGSN